MKSVTPDKELLGRVGEALTRCLLFSHLPAAQVAQIVTRCTLHEFDTGEALVTEGEESDSFFILLSGNAQVLMAGIPPDPYVEVARLQAYDTVGEMGLLLEIPRSATVRAASTVVAVRFAKDTFLALFMTMPNFGRALAQALASRLQRTQHRLPLPEYGQPDIAPTKEVLRLIPVHFIQRHRIIPLELTGQRLVLGFLDDPTPRLLLALYRLLPGLDLAPVRITAQTFDRLLHGLAALSGWTQGDRDYEPDDVLEAETASPRLDALLRRMIAEGASDLHLSAGQQPRWRLEGELLPLKDAAALSEKDVAVLLEPILSAMDKQSLANGEDFEFAHFLGDEARFRVAVFRDLRGVSAIFRHLPSRVPSPEDLGLPIAARALAEHASGLVVVTGSAGSGRSTTLAALLSHINTHKRVHIVTLEDPVEMVLTSDKALINHREAGTQFRTFPAGLRAALREDPDVIVLSHVPDHETYALALEAAHDGRLVFVTLGAPTALSALEAMIQMVPADRRDWNRLRLAELCRGIVMQTLCRRPSGGRVAAFEVLTMYEAIAAQLREGKLQQIPTLMATGGAFGNLVLNEDFVRLVKAGQVLPEQALARTYDRADLSLRIGRPASKPGQELKTTLLLKDRK